MTEEDIIKEMSAIAATIRNINAKRGKITRVQENDIRRLEQRHAALAKELGKIQLAEIRGRDA